ncbi:MAG: Stp1/IreP family PP2C-type Ser/Thr phosphatase [Lachnospiraceae bacterium]|nr:Stp1/IreP family PP2C-type Ser/Thr phosphatase [Lachnospiraceae bacterium]
MLTSFSRTDIGNTRKLNQDYIYTTQDKIGNLTNLFIVADGMGGHAAGDYASRTAVETIVKYIENSFEKNSLKLLTKAVETANNEVYTEALLNRRLEGMGTTIVAATFVGRYLQAINVGDSRLYIIRDKEIRQVSVDHSLVEEMIKSGGIAREQARNHPDKNIITRAVGVKSTVEPDTYTEELKNGDYVLLCSDGLTNMVPDEEIAEIIVKEEKVDEAVKKLIEKANENGGRDNISAMLVKYEA